MSAFRFCSNVNPVLRCAQVRCEQAPVEGGEGDAAAVAAAGAGAGAGASLANAPDATGAAAAVVPAERPPLTFLGNVGNIALAFVTSLFPSWEG
eukprot:COSAG06_NODE_5709_length_3311_cov_2.768991_3_plen_94_part_00